MIDFEALVRAVEMQESGGREDAVSPAGARGPMQIMPATAQNPGFGLQPLQNIDDPEANRQFGRQYLQAMIDYFDGDHSKALAAYNAGAGRVEAAVRSHGDRWLERMPEETRNYVPGVMGRLDDKDAWNINRRQVGTQEPPDRQQYTAEQRRALAEAAVKLKMQENANMKQAVQTPEGLSTAQQLLGGFYHEAAKLIGAPVELVDQAFRLAGSQLLEQPGDAVKAVNDAFASVGITTQPGEGLAGKIGRSSFHALTTLGGLTAMARPMAAAGAQAISGAGVPVSTAPTAGAGSRAVADMGQQLLQRPGAALAGEMGGVVGSELALDQAEARKDLPGWVRSGLAVLGGMAGATVGTSATGLNRMSASAAARDELRQTLPGRDAPAIRPEADPSNFRLAAEARAAQYSRQLDETVEGIQKKYQEVAPGEASAKLATELREAERAARAQEDALWAAVPKNIGIDPSRLNGFAHVLRAETTHAESARIAPSMMRKLLGKGEELPQTVGDWLQVRSDALNRARQAGAGNAPNRMLARNYRRVAQEISEMLGEQSPTGEIRAAADFSRHLNDVFTRGPVGRIMGFDRAGTANVADENVAKRLMSDPRGMRQVDAASTTGQDRESLREAARDAIRAEFGDAASKRRGGEFATSNRTRQATEPFPGLEDELVDAAKAFQLAVNAKKSQSFRALQEAAQQDPQVTIQRLYASPNPAEIARDLKRSIGDDPAALDGLRSGVVEEMLRRSNFSGRHLKESMANPKYDRLLRSVLSPQQVTRFHRMANAAAQIESGHGRLRGKAGRGAANLLARIFGAQLGRSAAVRMGGGTVQTPGIVARAATGATQFLLKGVPVSELLARGVIDPRMERLLLKQVKPDLPGFRRDVREMQAILGAMAGSTSDRDTDGQQSTR